MTGAEILSTLLACVAILQTWNASRVQRNTAKKEAAQALSEAVARTSQVVAAKDGGVDTRDYELTNLWHKASLAFRDADEPDLSRLCQIKGNYWTDPANWTTEQVHQAGIGLASMRDELQRILHGS